jgi:hypothetical protein
VASSGRETTPTNQRSEGGRGGITNGIIWQGNYADQSEARGREREWGRVNNQWHLLAGKLRRPIRGRRVEEGNSQWHRLAGNYADQSEVGGRRRGSARGESAAHLATQLLHKLGVGLHHLLGHLLTAGRGDIGEMNGGCLS